MSMSVTSSHATSPQTSQTAYAGHMYTCTTTTGPRFDNIRPRHIDTDANLYSNRRDRWTAKTKNFGARIFNAAFTSEKRTYTRGRAQIAQETARDAADSAKIGYNPKDLDSVRKFAKAVADGENPPGASGQKFYKEGAHFVLKEERRGNISSFIFVPNGDFSQARSIQVSLAKDGSKVTGDKLDHMIACYAAGHEEFQAEWPKKLHTMALENLKESGSTEPSEDEIKEEVAKLKKRYCHVVMDFKGVLEFRVFDKSGPDAGMNSTFKGISLPYSKSLKENIGGIIERKNTNKPILEEANIAQSSEDES